MLQRWVRLGWYPAGSCMHQTSLQQFHLPTRNFIVALPSSLNIPPLRLCITPPRFASARASTRPLTRLFFFLFSLLLLFHARDQSNGSKKTKAREQFRRLIKRNIETSIVFAIVLIMPEEKLNIGRKNTFVFERWIFPTASIRFNEAKENSFVYYYPLKFAIYLARARAQSFYLSFPPSSLSQSPSNVRFIATLHGRKWNSRSRRASALGGPS